MNQATHPIDVFNWFMGPIEELFGYWANLNHPYIEVEDTAIAVVRFRSGALGTVELSNSQKPGLYGKVHVHGENGASVGVQTDRGSSFVSGVGARSVLYGYGFNRADWSYIPGGSASGTGLIRPDYPELLEWPYLWQQTEYVLGGGTTDYLLLVLAADHLLNPR